MEDEHHIQSSRVRFDTLEIYGFSFNFPVADTLEFNPKFGRLGGDMAVKSPRKNAVIISWGPLDKITKKVQSPSDHADFNLEKLRKTLHGKMDVVARKEVTINGHRASYNHVRMTVPPKSLLGGKSIEQHVQSLHLHCRESSRYFVLHEIISVENPDEDRAFDVIMSSIKCHR